VILSLEVQEDTLVLKGIRDEYRYLGFLEFEGDAFRGGLSPYEALQVIVFPSSTRKVPSPRILEFHDEARDELNSWIISNIPNLGALRAVSKTVKDESPSTLKGKSLGEKARMVNGSFLTLPVPGWLRVGLKLRDKASGEFFRVTVVGPTKIEVVNTCRKMRPASTFRIVGLHQTFYGLEYFECDSCRQKPGSPTLCSNCLERRTEHGRLNYCELPSFIDRVYLGGLIPGTSREEIDDFIPTRFERNEVV
jgi:hypothetical protein